MSDVKNITNTLVDIKVPESVDNAVKNMTDEPTKTIGQIISDCVFLVFGGITQKAALKRAKYASELENFKKELETKVETIPEEKRLEPNLHTICTALDSMRYCVEEPELRNMFSTLIANSINRDTYESVHPSYGEIIRQLTAFDANLILWMKNQNTIPVVRFREHKKDNTRYFQFQTIHLEYDCDSIDLLQISLENLSRLKIINCNLETSLYDKNNYENVKKTKNYIEDKAVVESKIEEGFELKEIYGFIEITQFGKKFIDACC